ncbi:MAG: DUF2997 domain-containing protein [bacterium]
MSKNIEVIVNRDGSLIIDAVGFQGSDCEKATRFLEEALGRVAGKQKKHEYHRQVQRQQRVGA